MLIKGKVLIMSGDSSSQILIHREKFHFLITKFSASAQSSIFDVIDNSTSIDSIKRLEPNKMKNFIQTRYHF